MFHLLVLVFVLVLKELQSWSWSWSWESWSWSWCWSCKWFQSYLTSCTQHVRRLRGSARSTTVRLICGVPQGSVLGSILSIMYTADLVSLIQQYRLSPHLVAALVLSRLDYCNSLLFDLPAILIQRLQCSAKCRSKVRLQFETMRPYTSVMRLLVFIGFACHIVSPSRWRCRRTAYYTASGQFVKPFTNCVDGAALSRRQLTGRPNDRMLRRICVRRESATNTTLQYIADTLAWTSVLKLVSLSLLAETSRPLFSRPV